MNAVINDCLYYILLTWPTILVKPCAKAILHKSSDIQEWYLSLGYISNIIPEYHDVTWNYSHIPFWDISPVWKFNVILLNYCESSIISSHISLNFSFEINDNWQWHQFFWLHIDCKLFLEFDKIWHVLSHGWGLESILMPSRKTSFLFMAHMSCMSTFQVPVPVSMLSARLQ